MEKKSDINMSKQMRKEQFLTSVSDERSLLEWYLQIVTYAKFLNVQHETFI